MFLLLHAYTIPGSFQGPKVIEGLRISSGSAVNVTSGTQQCSCSHLKNVTSCDLADVLFHIAGTHQCSYSHLKIDMCGLADILFNITVLPDDDITALKWVSRSIPG